MVGHGGDADELADLAREVAVHQRLFSGVSSSHHPCEDLLVRLYAHAHQAVRSVLVLEYYANSCDLLDHVQAQTYGWLAEAEARALSLQLIDAVSYCHSRGVAHLDISPRNVLVAGGGRSLKLIDYGSSDFISPTETDEGSQQHAERGWVRERGGAPNCRAPERHLADMDEAPDMSTGDAAGDALGAGDGTACTAAVVGQLASGRFLAVPADVYSVGCVLHFMLHGVDVFDFEAPGVPCETVLQQIERAAISFGAQASAEARALIRRMLSWEPTQRPSLQAVRSDAWMLTLGPSPPLSPRSASVVAGVAALAV